MDYVVTEELRQFMAFPPGQEADDVDLQRALDAGRTWIDWFTGRTFGVEGTALAPSFRIYGATSETTVEVVDLQSLLPTVEVDTEGDRTFATTLLPSQFVVYPYDGPPFSQIIAWAEPGDGVDPVCFTPGQLVKVTGVWGHTDGRGRCPAPVAQANLLLGARWFKRKEVPLGVLSSPELGAFQVLPRQDADVLTLLFPLCLPGSPGAALLASQMAVAGAPYGAEWVMV